MEILLWPPNKSNGVSFWRQCTGHLWTIMGVSGGAPECINRWWLMGVFTDFSPENLRFLISGYSYEFLWLMSRNCYYMSKPKDSTPKPLKVLICGIDLGVKNWHLWTTVGVSGGALEWIYRLWPKGLFFLELMHRKSKIFNFWRQRAFFGNECPEITTLGKNHPQSP